MLAPAAFSHALLSEGAMLLESVGGASHRDGNASSHEFAQSDRTWEGGGGKGGALRNNCCSGNQTHRRAGMIRTFTANWVSSPSLVSTRDLSTIACVCWCGRSGHRQHCIELKAARREEVRQQRLHKLRGKIHCIVDEEMQRRIILRQGSSHLRH